MTPCACAERCSVELERAPAPGIYLDVGQDAASTGDATFRGQLLADSIIHGRHSQALRRGKKGALDVVVVGANVLGISATLHLMQAGLRVLLVDRHSWSPSDGPAPAPTSLRAHHEGTRRARLPLVTGHHVSVVARRSDGMLELQAERAAWYTANVIFAATHFATNDITRHGVAPAPSIGEP